MTVIQLLLYFPVVVASSSSLFGCSQITVTSTRLSTILKTVPITQTTLSVITKTMTCTLTSITSASTTCLVKRTPGWSSSPSQSLSQNPASSPEPPTSISAQETYNVAAIQSKIYTSTVSEIVSIPSSNPTSRISIADEVLDGNPANLLSSLTSEIPVENTVIPITSTMALNMTKELPPSASLAATTTRKSNLKTTSVTTDISMPSSSTLSSTSSAAVIGNSPINNPKSPGSGATYQVSWNWFNAPTTDCFPEITPAEYNKGLYAGAQDIPALCGKAATFTYNGNSVTVKYVWMTGGGFDYHELSPTAFARLIGSPAEVKPDTTVTGYQKEISDPGRITAVCIGYC